MKVEILNRYIFQILVVSLLSLVACNKEDPPGIIISNPEANPEVVVIQETIGSIPVIIAGSWNGKFVTAFKNSLHGEKLEILSTSKSLPALFEDSKGNIYNIFGEITAGDNVGSRLEVVQSLSGYWFAISNFYPGIEIYNDPRPFYKNPNELTDPDWLIPREFVFDGAGKDNIPSIDNPVFEDLGEENENDISSYLSDEDLVLLLSIDEESRIYPIPILNYHEIVNDQLGNTYFSVMYCPLTGTGNIWNRELSGEITEFGVSGLLYNNNLLPYDRNTSSIWSQITGTCVNGKLMGQNINYSSILEIQYGLARTIAPDAQIMTNNTGVDRNYSKYPYGEYRENNAMLLFPNVIDDPRLPAKDKVIAVIIGEEVKAFTLEVFK